MTSGGTSSWATGKRVAERHGTEDLVLLFADTREEDAETYRFLEQGAANVGGELVRIADGRTVWEVFFDERMIGNTRIDPCSKNLKRIPMRRWLEEHCDPQETTVYVGYDWTEGIRIDRARQHWAPWPVEFPLAEWQPVLSKLDVLEWCRRQELEPPALTRAGFPHSNCAGACVKAGQAQWRALLRERPEVYRRWETEEERFRSEIGKDVAILRDRRGGTTRPLPLRVLRETLEAGGQCDLLDWGGCGCLDPGDQDQ